MNSYNSISKSTRMVLFGDDLQYECTYKDPNARFCLPGILQNGAGSLIPFGDDLMSRHILLLGGIGSGKTNTFNHIIRNVRGNMTSSDVAIIFDTKGDYYRNFYRPGDIVISNDERATAEWKITYMKYLKSCFPKKSIIRVSRFFRMRRRTYFLR